jgi:hypothetical protein
MDFQSNNSKRLVVFCIMLATVVLYFPVYEFKYINFDDYDYVIHNPYVRNGVTLEGMVWALTSSDHANWYPLTWLSHMLDVQLFGLEPGGHHVTNVIFHLMNTLLLLFFLLKATGHFYSAALVAVLFAIHPAHVESVAWIAERKDVISTFFFFLSLVAYWWYVQNRVMSRYLLVFVSVIMAFMSKPMAITLPFVLMLMDFWPLGRVALTKSSIKSDLRVLVIEKLPFLMLVPLLGVMTFLAQQDSGAMTVGDLFSLAERTQNALVSYARYLGKAVYPVSLTVFYPHPGLWPVSKVILNGVLILVITLLTVLFYKRKPYLFVGWFIFLGTLVPVIGLVQVGAQSIADRYTYIPYLGLFIMLSWGIRDVVNYSAFSRTLIFTIIFGWLIAFWVMASTYLSYWKYDARLFSHTLQVHDPGYEAVLEGKSIERSVPFGLAFMYSNLGMSLMEVGLYDEAEVHLLEATRIFPQHFKPYYNLGLVYLKTGKYQKAREHIVHARKLSPEHSAEFDKDLELLDRIISDN